jgi:hypothetical protein
LASQNKDILHDIVDDMTYAQYLISNCPTVEDPRVKEALNEVEGKIETVLYKIKDTYKTSEVEEEKENVENMDTAEEEEEEEMEEREEDLE